MNAYFAWWPAGDLTGCGALEPTPSPLEGGERVHAPMSKQQVAA